MKRFVNLLLKKKKYHLDIKTENEHWKGKTQVTDSYDDEFCWRVYTF